MQEAPAMPASSHCVYRRTPLPFILVERSPNQQCSLVVGVRNRFDGDPRRFHYSWRVHQRGLKGGEGQVPRIAILRTFGEGLLRRHRAVSTGALRDSARANQRCLRPRARLQLPGRRTKVVRCTEHAISAAVLSGE